MRRISSKTPIWIALLAALTIGACKPSTLKMLETSERPWELPWREEYILDKGWAESRDLPPKPVYCYRTLGTPDCHGFHIPGDESRIVGLFGPSPF